MKYCSNCGTASPDDAKFCVECGAKLLIKGQAPVSQQNQPAKANHIPIQSENSLRKNIADTSQEKESDKKSSGTLARVILFVIVLLVFIRGCAGCNESYSRSSGYSSSSSSHRASEHFLTNAEAFTCAEEIVKANLKSPSTAKFCKITEATIKYMGDGRYKVTGYVDAQNGYGATVRGDFVVHFTEVYDGKDIGYKEGTCYIENR